MIRIRSVFSGLPGLPGFSDLYFTGEGGQAAVDAHTNVESFWLGMAPGMSNNMTITVDGEIAILNEATGEVQSYQTESGIAVTGTRTDQTLPSPVQLCLNFQTGGVRSGRKVRGRMFIPGFTSDNNTDLGQPTQTIRDFAVAQYLDYINEGLAEHVIWTRPRLADPSATPPVAARAGQAFPATSVSSKATWAVLRSRRD